MAEVTSSREPCAVNPTEFRFVDGRFTPGWEGRGGWGELGGWD